MAPIRRPPKRSGIGTEPHELPGPMLHVHAQAKKPQQVKPSSGRGAEPLALATFGDEEGFSGGGRELLIL